MMTEFYIFGKLSLLPERILITHTSYKKHASNYSIENTLYTITFFFINQKVKLLGISGVCELE